LQKDKDLSGKTLKEVSGSSEMACCSECDKLLGCEGYAYNAQWKKCYLKSSVGGTYLAAGVVTRTKAKAPVVPKSCSVNYGDLQKDKDLSGKTLKEVSGSSEAACCGECDKVSVCEGYAYSAQWKKCYLKGSVGGTYPAAGVVTRTKAKAPVAPKSCSADYGDLQKDKDLSGKTLKEVSGSSEAACCDECDKVSGCEGYAYSAQWKKCYLKGSVGGTYPAAGSLARTKAKAPIDSD